MYMMHVITQNPHHNFLRWLYEQSEAQRGPVVYPKSHSYSVLEATWTEVFLISKPLFLITVSHCFGVGP